MAPIFVRVSGKKRKSNEVRWYPMAHPNFTTNQKQKKKREKRKKRRKENER